MTIDEAIKRLTSQKHRCWDYNEEEDALADQLGIEALKEVRKARYGDPALDGELLPGETK